MAMDYVVVHQNGAFNSEEDYPYVPVRGDCKFDASKAVGHVSGLVNVTTDDEEDLKEKVANMGPAAVCVDTHLTSFQLYKEGVYSDPHCNTLVDHCVGIVGYGAEDTGEEYWILRNSWGTDWALMRFRVTLNGNNLGV